MSHQREKGEGDLKAGDVSPKREGEGDLKAGDVSPKREGGRAP